MSWGGELVKIRRMLRDPDGTIWSDAFLKHLYNDVQKDLQNRTNVLEDASAQRVPGLYQFAYLFDWEYRYLTGSQFYQALNQHDDGVCCHRWEPQQVAGISADVSDYGSHFTQPWEAYMTSPGEIVRMPFPRNFDYMKFIAYDEEPIAAQTKKDVQSHDPSNVTREGVPLCYYPYDEVSNDYVLYPRPSTSFVNELDGNDGAAFFADGDTEDTTTGTIATSTGAYDDGLGVSFDVIGTTSNVFMVYGVTPTDVEALEDEPDFPEFLRKYIRFDVIARAYGGNNDGRIRSLSDLWSARYQMGIELVKRYLRNKRQDRDYRLVTKGSIPRRTVKHPRLPDGYPAV